MAHSLAGTPASPSGPAVFVYQLLYASSRHPSAAMAISNRSPKHNLGKVGRILAPCSSFLRRTFAVEKHSACRRLVSNASRHLLRLVAFTCFSPPNSPRCCLGHPNTPGSHSAGEICKRHRSEVGPLVLWRFHLRYVYRYEASQDGLVLNICGALFNAVQAAVWVCIEGGARCMIAPEALSVE